MKTVPILSAILFSFSFNSAIACGYDAQMNNPFTLAFPGSLTVALATQSAIAQELIPAIPSLAGPAGLARSVRWLEQFRAQLEAQQYQGQLSILLVDSGLWSRMSDSNTSIMAANDLLAASQRLRLETHSSPPNNETVLITSEATLAAVLSGEISLQAAKAAGLVRLQLHQPQDATMLGLK